MNLLKNWVLNLSILLIVYAILDNLIPEGNNKNIANTILKIIILFTVFAGLSKFKKFNSNIFKIDNNNTNFSSKEIYKKTQNNMKEQVKNLTVKNLENSTLNLLKNKGISAKNVNISMNIENPQNIFINKTKILINRIDLEKKEQIELLVKDFLNLRTLKEIEVIAIP